MIINLIDTVIETDRLRLRAFTEDDLNDLYEYASIEGVGEAAGWKHHESLTESKNILDMFINSPNILAITLKENGKVIGSLGLHDSWAKDEPAYCEMETSEIGYVLTKDYWGRGLMTEAVRAVISYCFDVIGIEVLTVGHFDTNDRSRRVIEKCGFTFFGEGVYHARQLGCRFDEKKYIMFKDKTLAGKTASAV